MSEPLSRDFGKRLVLMPDGLVHLGEISALIHQVDVIVLPRLAQAENLLCPASEYITFDAGIV